MERIKSFIFVKKCELEMLSLKIDLEYNHYYHMIMCWVYTALGAISFGISTFVFPRNKDF